MGKTLMTVGAILLLIGLCFQFGEKFGLGRLPGDISVVRDGFALHIPIASCIIISIVLSIIFRIINYFR